MVRVCANCGARNRVPAKHLADTGRCGSCKALLAPVAEPMEAAPETFDEIVREARAPILVDFWAAWCGPCRAAAPEVHAVAQALSGRALVLKVDTERYSELAARYQVQSIPNFVVLRNKRTIFQQPGLVSRDQLRSWLEIAAAA